MYMAAVSIPLSIPMFPDTPHPNDDKRRCWHVNPVADPAIVGVIGVLVTRIVVVAATPVAPCAIHRIGEVLAHLEYVARGFNTHVLNEEAM